MQDLRVMPSITKVYDVLDIGQRLADDGPWQEVRQAIPKTDDSTTKTRPMILIYND